MKKYLCIDVGGTFIKYGILDSDGSILSKDKIPTPHTDHKGFTECIRGITPKDVCGIAICFPGFIDGENGVCLSCGTLQWMADNYEIVKEISWATGLPVTVENDAHCACFAEMWKGSMQGVKDGAVMVIGTAVGMCIIIDGRLYTGSSGKAGEPGYTLCEKNQFWGFACSVPMLCSEAAEKLGRKEMSGQELMRMYADGDETVMPVVNEYYRYLTEGIFTIQNLFDFEKISIGGGISANETYISALKEKLHAIYASLPYQLHEPLITACEMKNDANLTGALYYHLTKIK